MPIDLARRKKIMARSIALGHCVCNPKQPCPCDDFRARNRCACAGEKPWGGKRRAPLTALVSKAGCASKIGQADLLRILGGLPTVADPDVLVGAAAGDDAGVYRLGDGRALVQTVDVFTPCVDDPFLFGRIAAANSVSDVYAMGGRPLTALSIIGFPIEELDEAMMAEILRGGMETLAEAGCALIGGHSINSAEIMCGFAVTGLIEEREVLRRDAPAEGDVLVLTKPLGTGIVSFATQIGRVAPVCLEEAGASMAALNRDAAELMHEFGARACTDITGFGLTGHLSGMVRTSGLAAEIDLADVPVFAVVPSCLEAGIIPGAVERNREYTGAWVDFDSEADAPGPDILFDPQTSGGLLVALPPERAGAYVAALRARGHAAASVIGQVVRPETDHDAGRVRVTGTELKNLHGTGDGMLMQDDPLKRSGVDSPAGENRIVPEARDIGDACCDSPPDIGEDAPQSSALDAFGEFMRTANGKGVIDRRTKKLLAIALSVAQRCRPCLVAHLKGARSMGITRAEIDEAAAMAVSFAGCPSLMLYKEVCGEVYG